MAEAAALHGMSIQWHGLADVKSFIDLGVPASSTVYCASTRTGESHVLRLEEALAVQAERTIGMVKDGVARDSSIAVDDALIIHRDHKSHKQIPLHGYRFNRTGSHSAIESEYVPNLPSCEAFIASTVLEQVGMHPAVVRYMPYWMKDRELAAREMLRLAGFNRLPVLSVIAGKHGDVEKLLPWSKDLPTIVSALKPYIKERQAHRVSALVTKQIHDQAFARFSQIQKRELAKPSAIGIKAFEVTLIKDIEERLRAFADSDLRGAVIYEAHKIHDDNVSDTLQDITTLLEMFNADDGTPDDMVDTEMYTYPGRNTNSVTTLGMRLAEMEDRSSIGNQSDRITLYGHFVFEDMPSDHMVLARGSQTIKQSILQQFDAHAPRSVLMEVHRLPRKKETA